MLTGEGHLACSEGNGEMPLGRRFFSWKGSAAVFLVCLAILTAPRGSGARTSEPGCQHLRLSPAVGRTGVLGTYAELAATCGIADGGVLRFGVRYTESRMDLRPYAALQYVWPLGDTTVSLNVGLRERIGDWEVDRLPEVTVRWTLNPPSLLRGALEVTFGRFSTHAAGEGGRVGARLRLSSRTMPVRSGTTWLTLDAAHYRYDRSQTQTSLQWTVHLHLPLTRDLGFQLGYQHVDAFGLSPLRFDSVSPTRVWSGYLLGPVGQRGTWWAGLSADTWATPAILELHVGGRMELGWLSLTYRLGDGRVFLTGGLVSSGDR